MCLARQIGAADLIVAARSAGVLSLACVPPTECAATLKVHLNVAQWPTDTRPNFSGWYKDCEIAHYVGDQRRPASLHVLQQAPPGIGKKQKDPIHTSNFGVKLKERLHEVGVECELYYRGNSGASHPSVRSHLIDRLTRDQSLKPHNIPLLGLFQKRRKKQIILRSLEMMKFDLHPKRSSTNDGNDESH
jgi:hypothetical protein